MDYFKLGKTPAVLKTAFVKWWSKDPFKESSVIAYSAIFSLPGLLVLVVTLAGYFFGHELVTNHIHSTISSVIGVDTADQIQQMIIFSMKSKDSLLASIIGVITILLGATGVFVQLQKSLNIIWEVEAKVKKSGILQMLKLRLFSFGLILTIAFLLLISLVLSSFLAATGDWIMKNWSITMIWLFKISNFILTLAFITVLFAAMFQILPDAEIKWKYVWVGAFITTLLFMLGKYLLGLYFGTAEPGSGYGTAGSVILIMLWTSYSSMIFFFGAEFTKAYSLQYFGKVPANDVAVKKPGRVV